MRKDEIQELAEYYDSNDLSAEIEQAEPENDTDNDPMITTSLRLPKSVLDRVRVEARAAGVKPTALIRRWVEEAVNSSVQQDNSTSKLTALLLEHLELRPAYDLAQPVEPVEVRPGSMLLVDSSEWLGLMEARIQRAVHDELAPVRRLLSDRKHSA